MVYSLLYCTRSCMIYSIIICYIALNKATCYIVWYIACYITPNFLPATLHSVCSPPASVRDGSLPLQLRLGDSNPAWLSPALTPHPNVDLIKPAAVASSIPAVSHSSLAVSKAVGQCWSPVPLHKAWREWHPAQDVPRQAKVQAVRNPGQ